LDVHSRIDRTHIDLIGVDLSRYLSVMIGARPRHLCSIGKFLTANTRILIPYTYTKTDYDQFSNARSACGDLFNRPDCGFVQSGVLSGKRRGWIRKILRIHPRHSPLHSIASRARKQAVDLLEY
jgi:hypothetical protein